MTSLNQFLLQHGCPKCSGPVVIDPEELPDRTYELLCLSCGNRTFPVELEVTVNMLIKLNRQGKS